MDHRYLGMRGILNNVIWGTVLSTFFFYNDGLEYKVQLVRGAPYFKYFNGLIYVSCMSEKIIVHMSPIFSLHVNIEKVENDKLKSIFSVQQSSLLILLYDLIQLIVSESKLSFPKNISFYFPFCFSGFSLHLLAIRKPSCTVNFSCFLLLIFIFLSRVASVTT